MGTGAVTFFLGGDVMTGRGVDQVLPHPSPPGLREPAVHDARGYVRLAERAAGAPIPRPVDFAWPWGDALTLLDDSAPDVRLVNLETSVTRSDDYAAEKTIHYRMHPDNLPCLTAARLDACALANNHLLDFGVPGLLETLDALAGAGLRPVGAGRNEAQAWRPAVLDVAAGRVLVWSVGLPSSGVLPSWAATADRAGVAFLPDATEAGAARIAECVRREKRPGDLVVVSIHWGSNWGYHVPANHVRFAHDLIDAGVDIVHGHSSHHPRPIEIYRNRPVLYGCGDLIDDYEGISGYESYRNDLKLLYLVDLEPGTGELRRLRLAPMQIRQLRLRHASLSDAQWLCDVLRRISRPYGTSVDREPDGTIVVS